MSRRRRPGHGSAHRSPAVRRFSVGIDDDTASEIHSRAARAGISAAEQLRQLVEWGLEADQADHERTADAAARSPNR